jgi:hypothetical protein
MEDHLPYGFKHIKAKATEGVDILMEEIKKKENSILPF